MRIYTEKKIAEIKNQCLNKIYNALNELHEKDNSDESGLVRSRHDELLDIALKHLNSKPTPNCYGWILRATMKGIFYK